MAKTIDLEKNYEITDNISQRQNGKRIAHKAPTWPLPHGEGQGPRPGDHTLPPLKKKKLA